MIDVVSRSELNNYPAMLEAMFRLRYRVFHERLAWRVSTRGDKEHDSFDDLNPLYLLANNDNGELVGTWRMLPTVGPYLLRDVFPQLLDGGPAPANPNIWEGSRFAVDCSRHRRNGLGTPGKVTAEIFCAVVEFGLALGLREVVTVYDGRIARLLPRIGCHPQWQSRRHLIDGTVTLAGRFYINEQALEKIRRANGITGSVIRSAPWLVTQAA